MKKYNIRFFVSFIFHCPLLSFVTLSFLTVVCYNRTECFVVSTQKSAMLYLFRESLYAKLLPLTTGFPSVPILYVQFFKPYYVKNQSLNLIARFINITIFSTVFGARTSITEPNPA